uniref:hypothetical protein n=1 Tax=Rickettsia gravesii TaxID=354585 RepID=UPI00035E8856|nr:hypothetical protein [Rickettsia gravesii]
MVTLAENLIVKIKAERAEASRQVSLFTDDDSVGKRGRPVKKQLSDIIPVNAS